MGIVGSLAVGRANGVRLPVMGGEASLPLQAVTNRGLWQSASGAATTAANNLHISRTNHTFIDVPVKSIAFSATTRVAGPETAGPGFILRADAEYNGVCVPFTWGGAPSRTLVSGDHDIVPDEIPATAFGVSQIPAGATVFIKYERELAVGVSAPYWGSDGGAFAGESALRAPSGTASRIGIAGPLGTPSGYAGYSVIFGPIIVLGRPATKRGATVVYGASIETGTNDTATGTVTGYVGRAINSGTKLAACNLAVGGESLATFLTRPGYRLALAKYFPGGVAINGYGGNDYSGGQTREQTAINFADFSSRLKAAGLAKVGRVRMSPKADSTDSYATTTNQTVRANFLAFRTYVDAQADPNLDLLIDLTTAQEPTGDPGKWVVNGTANYATLDGTHPETPIHILMAPVFRSGLNVLIASL